MDLEATMPLDRFSRHGDSTWLKVTLEDTVDLVVEATMPFDRFSRHGDSTWLNVTLEEEEVRIPQLASQTARRI